MEALVITPEMEADLQEFARRIGKTPNEALAEVLHKNLEALPVERLEQPAEREVRLRKADATLKRLQALPWDRTRTADEILGFDEADSHHETLVGR